MTDRGRKWFKSSYNWIAALTALLAVLAACSGSSTVAETPESPATPTVTARATSTAPLATHTPLPPSEAYAEGTRSATSTPAPSTPTVVPSPESDEASLTTVSDDLPDDPSELMLATLDGNLNVIAQKMANSGNKSYIPVLLEFVRFLQSAESRIAMIGFINKVLEGTDSPVIPTERNNWDWWIEWLGNHPEIQAPDGFAGWKGRLYSFVDPNFRIFLHDGVKTRIRLEEVVWGGVRKDGIPDLINPPVVSAADATYLKPSDRVFGVSFNGESRAYPLRILNPHEMANDVVGGVHFALAY